MSKALPILLALLGFGGCFSLSQSPTSAVPQIQSPIEDYINILREHRMNNAAAGFTQLCGVKLDEAVNRFAVANDDAGTWKVVPDLPDAWDNLEMDLFNTAEVWKNPAGTLIEMWETALDVGGFERTLYCFNASGRLKAIDSANYQIPEKGRPWGMHKRWVLQANGKFRAVIPFEFIGLDDKTIPHPKLGVDSETFAVNWRKKLPGPLTIRQLKLPPALFQ